MSKIQETREAVRIAGRELGAKSWAEGKKDKAAYAIVLKELMEAADAYALQAHVDECFRTKRGNPKLVADNPRCGYGWYCDGAEKMKTAS